MCADLSLGQRGFSKHRVVVKSRDSQAVHVLGMCNSECPAMGGSVIPAFSILDSANCERGEWPHPAHRPAAFRPQNAEGEHC